MGKSLIFLLLLLSFSVFADQKAYEKEKFKGIFTKHGESFVCMMAYDIAKENALNAGFSNCSQTYEYQLTSSLTENNKFTCKTYVECSNKTVIQQLGHGEAAANYDFDE